MKHLLVILIPLIFLSSYSCQSDCSSPGYHRVLDSTKIITFLSRDGTSGYKRSIAIDNLLIDKNIAKHLSIYDYSKIARQYVDTVLADRLVADVDFYGVTSCDVEISPGSLNMADYELISFSFDYDERRKQPGMGTSKIWAITLWKNGENKSFWEDGMVMDNGRIIKNLRDKKAGRAFLDSLENLRMPLKEVLKNLD